MTWQNSQNIGTAEWRGLHHCPQNLAEQAGIGCKDPDIRPFLYSCHKGSSHLHEAKASFLVLSTPQLCLTSRIILWSPVSLTFSWPLRPFLAARAMLHTHFAEKQTEIQNMRVGTRSGHRIAV